MSGGANGGFFRSRWIEPPTGIEELEPRSRRASAAWRRLRPQALGGHRRRHPRLRCCDSALGSAADPERRRRGPIRVCRERCDQGALRAVVVNSGNANAATGEQGYADAIAMQERATRPRLRA